MSIEESKFGQRPEGGGFKKKRLEEERERLIRVQTLDEKFSECSNTEEKKGIKNELYDLYREDMERIKKEYPEVFGEMKRVAQKVGFKEILITPIFRTIVAWVDPEIFPDTIFWSEESLKRIVGLNKFAPEFSSAGLKLVTRHEKEHLKGPSLEAFKLSKASYLVEGQTELQSLVMFERDYKELLKEGECSNIIEAIAIKVVFVDFLSRGPISLREEPSTCFYQHYYFFLKTEVIAKIEAKHQEIKKELLKKYQNRRKNYKKIKN